MSQMFNKRDELFLKRMGEYITNYEMTELRQHNVFVRTKSRKLDNIKVLEYTFKLLQTGMSWYLL